MTEVENLLQNQGVSYTKEGNECLVDKCLFCGKEKHLYINSITGMYDCKRCGATGNLYKLKEHFGLITSIGPLNRLQNAEPLPIDTQQKAVLYRKNLLKDKEKLLELMHWWKISHATIKKHYLGYTVQNGVAWLSIPTVQDGLVYNIKYRSWKGEKKAFRREKGGASVLYNADVLEKTEDSWIILNEGEKDVISLLNKGITNTVGNSGGANTFKPDWLPLFDKFERIYICYDVDVAGDQGVRKLVKKLGVERCYTVQLPSEEKGYDVSDYFAKDNHTKEDFEQLLSEAKLCDVPGVITLAEGYSELFSRFKTGQDTPTITTPWARINSILNGGFFDGQLITLGGPAKSMKTNLAYLIGEHNAKKGVPVLIYELEMSAAELAKRNITRVESMPYALMSPLDVLVTQFKQRNLPIYIGKPSGNLTPDVVVETIKAAYKRYGIGFVIIDHGHIIIRSEAHLVEKLGAMVKKIAFLAKELEIPILLLAQPNKSKDTRVRGTYNSLGWSNTFGTDSDVIIMLHRNRSDQLPAIEDNTEQDIIQRKLGGPLDISKAAFSPIVHFYVDAARTSNGGYVKLWCDDLFFNIEEVDDIVDIDNNLHATEEWDFNL